MVARGAQPAALTYIAYLNACIQGWPDGSIVRTFQLDSQTPVAVNWNILFSSDGAAVYDSDSPVSPSGPAFPSLPWAYNLRPVGGPMGGLLIEWQVAGVPRRQIVDLTFRGSLVLPCADWVRVRYCVAFDGEPLDWPSVDIQVRPAMEGERSVARASSPIYQSLAGVAIMVPVAWGDLVQQVDWHADAANAVGTGANAYGLRWVVSAGPTRVGSSASAVANATPLVESRFMPAPIRLPIPQGADAVRLASQLDGYHQLVGVIP